MRTTLVVMGLVAAMSAAAFAQELTKDDIVRLAKEGVSDDVIVAKIRQEKKGFALSPDDILALKKSGVSDKVLEAMMAQEAKPEEPRPTVEADANAVLKNSSHREMRVAVDAKERTLNLSRTAGVLLKKDDVAGWKLAEGAWTIAIDGQPTIDTFEVKAGAPAMLTLKGADTSYIDVVTLIVEDGNGRNVTIVSSVGKLSESQLSRDPRARPPGAYQGMMGVSYRSLPLLSNRVLLGAGIGAIIGHQSGHRTEGAVIGAAAGLLLDWHFGRRW